MIFSYILFLTNILVETKSNSSVTIFKLYKNLVKHFYIEIYILQILT